MKARDFLIVDVFTERRYSGNQLAVVMAGPGMEGREMQAIACEMNFSETTFIISETPSKKGYRVRIFTPREEIPFAGHPTLGTAYVIRRHLAPDEGATVILDLDAGSIPVSAGPPEDNGSEGELLFMKQRTPAFGVTTEHEDMAEVLGLDVSDLGEYPVQVVSTGLPHHIVPVRSLEAMKRISLNRALYYEFVSQSDAKAIMAFTPDAYEGRNGLHMRMFAPFYGIAEDPATGSGAGCLAAYLVKHKVLGTGELNIRAEQGYEIGRPSLLHLRAGRTRSEIWVQVGGRVIPVAEGRLL